jgi:hypothetical protein
MEILDLSKATKGFFESNGYAEVAVTKNGKKKIYKIPIKTTNDSKLLKEFEEKYPEPKPPVVTRLVKTVDGVNFELAKRGEHGAVIAKIYDFTDEKYKEAKGERDKKALLLSLMIALGLETKFGIDKIDEFEQWLNDLGLNGQHLQSIGKALQELNATDAQEMEDDIKNV